MNITMKFRTLAFLVVSHALIGLIGFGTGIYVLPILIAPPAPTTAQIEQMASNAQFSGEFRRDLQDSDAFHWGEGQVAVAPTAISLLGELSPGPDYKLYLSPQFVETEVDFERIKASMALVGDVKTFSNFVVDVPNGINPANFNSVIIWCETFSEFITAAKYQ